MNGGLGSTEVMHSRDKAVYISKEEAGVAHYRTDIEDTLRSFTGRGRSGITLGRYCYSIAATSCRRRTARGYRSSPFASSRRLAFGLKLPQQLLCSLPAHLVFITLSPSSLGGDPYDLPLLFIQC